MAVTSGSVGGLGSWYTYSWVLPMTLLLMVLSLAMALSLYLLWRQRRSSRSRNRSDNARHDNSSVSDQVWNACAVKVNH
jgi:hypothetical protein